MMNRDVPSSYPAQADRVLSAVRGAETAVHRGCPADRYLAELFRANRAFGSKTRRLISDTVFSWFRWRGWLYSNESAIAATDVALAHALDANDIHPLMAFMADETPLAPWGSLDLNDKAAGLSRATKRTSTPTPELLAPSWAVEHMAIPESEEREHFVDALLASCQHRPPTWLRFRRPEREIGLRTLRDLDYEPEIHSDLPDAAQVAAPLSRAHIDHVSPFLAIQDLASQCVGLIADPHPKESWWDVCAGAGGKTLHLADLMKYEGRILATEPREDAVRELKRRALCQKAQAPLKVIPSDAREVKMDSLFDGVLIDAPCSGMGTWSRAPDARWRMPYERVTELIALQFELLRHASRAVRDGGTLIYAVCTLTSEETVSQVRAFEEAHPDFIPQSFIHPLTRKECRGSAWILPWHGPCGAMFVAKWRRKTFNA